MGRGTDLGQAGAVDCSSVEILDLFLGSTPEFKVGCGA